MSWHTYPLREGEEGEKSQEGHLSEFFASQPPPLALWPQGQEALAGGEVGWGLYLKPSTPTPATPAGSVAFSL